MARLKVKEVADAHGYTLSRLHDAINRRRAEEEKPIAMGTLRRYWYSTKDGKESGAEIEIVDLMLLGTIARILGVSVFELMNEPELGNRVPALHEMAA